jgi:hypothetical protein
MALLLKAGWAVFVLVVFSAHDASKQGAGEGTLIGHVVDDLG